VTHHAITCRCVLVGRSIHLKPRKIDSTWASSRPSDLTTMSFAIPHVKNSRGKYSSWLQHSDSWFMQPLANSWSWCDDAKLELTADRVDMDMSREARGM
jgi:hypothetical protein